MQNIVKLIENQHIRLQEWYLFEAAEMAVFGDDVVGSGGNGAVGKLVVIFVDVAEQMEILQCFVWCVQVLSA